MSKGVFNVPIAINEPVKSYIKGSEERVELLNTYKEMYNSNLDIPYTSVTKKFSPIINKILRLLMITNM